MVNDTESAWSEGTVDHARVYPREVMRRAQSSLPLCVASSIMWRATKWPLCGRRRYAADVVAFVVVPKPSARSGHITGGKSGGCRRSFGLDGWLSR